MEAVGARGGQESARAARCTPARTYLLAAATAGVGLGVRRRAAAAPGRGVKVPGIILVHDPRWGPERKQGGFLPRPRRGRAQSAARSLVHRAGRGLGFSLPAVPQPGQTGGSDAREMTPLTAAHRTWFLLSKLRGTGCPPGPSL